MARRLMRALAYDGYVNGAIGLKHVEVGIPSPRKDEVLINIEAVSLNPVDWNAHKLRILLRPFLDRKNSASIPCTDVAGEVVEIGSQVKNFKPGDVVVAILSTCGGLSQYGVAKESLITVSRPIGVSAAGLPIAGLTAHMALTQFAGLRHRKSEPQKNVLVTNASGGVGLYAVQLAKLGNAHVTATCGARNAVLLKSMGADEVLDYKTAEGASLKSPSGRKYDAVIHCAPTPVSWSVFEENLGENGVVVDLTPGPTAMWTYAVKKLTRSKKKLLPLIMIPKDDECLKYLVGLVKEGKLKTVIDSKYGLSEGEEAWSKGVSGHATGKIIVEP
ncbi:hypothetical protein ACS0TY_020046 [Phlomoides rotata]